MQILIAEDDPITRLLLELTIQKHGHQCICAEDGLQAWQLFQNQSVDVIISDWMMPGMDGIELCHRVRGQAKEGYTYFIFLTALADKAHLLKGISMGADDYLVKPLDPNDLKIRLLVATRITGLHRELATKKTELESLNTELYRQARRDSLTQLRNRLALSEDMEEISANSNRYHQNYCLVMCDIDYFKKYNDRYGHLAGDEVVRQVAGALKGNCRKGDKIYRYGGEEFLIILPYQSLASGEIAAEHYRKAVENLAISHELNPPLGLVTLSLGVAALVPGNIQNMDRCLQEADQALYLAKEAGRNRVAAFRVTVPG
jgi:two-component system, cell cycle response regulator